MKPGSASFGLSLPGVQPEFAVRCLASLSRAPGDAAYSRIEQQLQQLGNERDAIGSRMRSLLLGAAFGGQPVDPGQAAGLIHQGEQLIGQAGVLAR